MKLNRRIVVVVVFLAVVISWSACSDGSVLTTPQPVATVKTVPPTDTRIPPTQVHTSITQPVMPTPDVRATVVAEITATALAWPTETGTPQPAATQTPSPEPTASPTPVPPTSTPQATVTPTPLPDPVVFEFSGSGDKVVGPFELQEGVVRYAAQHSGSRNFVVKFIGERDELSINIIGRYIGGRAHQVSADNRLGLKPGPHRLEITADGSWTLKFTQDFPTAGVAPPFRGAGTGDEVLSWVTLNEGTYTLSAKHMGSRNFIVRLLSADGWSVELLINVIGDYDGQKIVKVASGLSYLPPGLYAVVVQADGDWSIVID